MYYYLIYYQNFTTIIFNRFSYDLINNNFINSNSGYSYNLKTEKSVNNIITCETMNLEKNDVYTCFLGTVLNNNYSINCIIFDENFKVKNTTKTKTPGITNFYNIKSSLMTIEGRKKVLIVSSIYLNKENSIFYAGYDISTNTFKEGIIKNKANCSMTTGYINNKFFVETEEFIISIYSQCKKLNQDDNGYNFLLYSFDKNFNYSFFGTIRNFILAPIDQNENSLCSPLTHNSDYLHSIEFSLYTQKYCFIGYFLWSKTTSFIINKEINIINPIVKNSKNNLKEFICENYSDFNPQSTDYIFLHDSSMNYLPKCTLESTIINENCQYHIINTKIFSFNFNCSKKFPYELIHENKYVEYCDNNSLSNGTCKLDYYNFTNAKISSIPIDKFITDHLQIIRLLKQFMIK